MDLQLLRLRYANRRSGEKYEDEKVLPHEPDTLDKRRPAPPRGRALQGRQEGVGGAVLSTGGAFDPLAPWVLLLNRRAHRVVAAVHVDQLPRRRRPPVGEEAYDGATDGLGVSGLPA